LPARGRRARTEGERAKSERIVTSTRLEPHRRGGRMKDMPGTNLTREEAQTRAALLDVDSYTIDLDLTTSETTFASTTTIRFTSREVGASTFADLVDAEVHEIILNGRSLDPATAYVDSRIL